MHEKVTKIEVIDKFFPWDFDYLVKIEKSIKKVLKNSDDDLVMFYQDLLEEINFRQLFKGEMHD